MHPGQDRKLSMWCALNMLHTFRVGDAFLTAIIEKKSFVDERFKKNLMKLSPIPCGNETQRLIKLFWGNPYTDNSLPQTKPLYGLFFNYDLEIELIYHRHTSHMDDEINSVLDAAAAIFYDIDSLNKRIGKVDRLAFDHTLVYYIAGNLLDNHRKPCFGHMSQKQLAALIYNRIVNPQFRLS